MKRILIVTGGTGGHIFPAMALGDYLESEGWEIFYLIGGSKLKLEENGEIYNIKVSSPLVGNLFKRIKSIWELKISFVKSLMLIKKLRVDLILAGGSYASFPAICASIVVKTPFYLLEQNVLPGLVTKIFSPYAKAVFTGFEATKNYLKGNIVHTGNPIRKKALLKIDKIEAKRKLGIPDYKKMVLVVGGSMGAYSVVNAIIPLIEELNDFYFIIQTGKKNFGYFSDKMGVKGKNHMLISFIEDMGLYYSAADIVISRAGASAVTEIAYHSLPAILIPYPHSRDRHQYYNAKVLADCGMAIIVEEESDMPDRIKTAIKNFEALRKEHKECKIYKPDCLQIIREVIEKNGTFQKG